jgi:type I restriction enzyme M protein
MKEQGLLFSEDSLLPEKLPQIQELRTSKIYWGETFG